MHYNFVPTLQPWSRKYLYGNYAINAWNYLEMIGSIKRQERYVFKWMMQFKTVGEGTDKEGAMSLKLLSTTIT
jgi:hypothetical protein